MSTKNDSEDKLRDEYSLDELEIVGVGKGWTRQMVWAVCIIAESAGLVPLKLYRAEFYPQLTKAKIVDENGKTSFYPQDWFLPVKFDKKVKSVLEKVS